MTTLSREITNHGKICKLIIPGGWEELTVYQAQFSSSTVRRFSPIGHGSAELSLYYRGVPVDAGSGAEFQKVLAQPSHDLTEQEMKLLHRVLGNASLPDAYKMYSARTEDVGGKRVLVLEGEWTGSKKRHFGVYVDAAGTGKVVQEIHFLAPREDYSKYIGAAEAAIRDIEWKE